jgi:FdhD protein
MFKCILMTETYATSRHYIGRVSAGHLIDKEDLLAVEEPLEISINYLSDGQRISKNISVTMRTPGDDHQLAVGFLFTEGIITHSAQIQTVTGGQSRQSNRVSVKLRDDVVPLLHSTERNFYTTSSCGICGKSSIDSIRNILPESTNERIETLHYKTLFRLTEVLRQQQTIFRNTGGLHASALFDLEGNFQMLCEDVGRHNALDKLIGTLLLNNHLPLSGKILLLSGRASFELIQKAAMAGIQFIVAIGAPSSLAVELAEERDMTLAGFLRGDTFNIYSGKSSITGL